jgi:uncharacterized membrane protein YdfJ with MMPL/SSD domain
VRQGPHQAAQKSTTTGSSRERSTTSRSKVSVVTSIVVPPLRRITDRTGDPREAAIGGLAHSGRVIFAAAAVMVAVFFTFALSGPLPPKEMGVILGIAVLLDAMLIRLVLMPTLLRVFGHRAWALPRWLDRLLPDVRFGHS